MADPFSLASLCGAMIVAVAIVKARRSSPLRAGFTEALGALVPRGALSHSSTALDVKVYLVGGLLRGTALSVFIIGAEAWRGWTMLLLDRLLGASAPMGIAPWIAGALATLVGVIAFDLGYYIAHWLGHHSPLLWRFHMKHHSATMLTPLTGLREHPVDTLVFSNLIGFCIGVSNAVLGHFIGPIASPYLLFQTNCVLIVYFLTLDHLRHSQLWLPFTGVLGHVFQSPAHHQLHHSNDPAHHNRNLGFMLSIFDALFGTLRIPRPGETVRFGIDGAPAGESLRDFYFQPFESARAYSQAQPGSE